jgi:divalent metal cation (Fe/Co/Zn/Cd) transporter
VRRRPMRYRDPARAALGISWVSIAWSAVVGTTSVVLGVFASSLALMGSGASLLIDLTSSAVLVWRFTRHHAHPTAERLAHRVAGFGLLALTTALIVASITRLITGSHVHVSDASVAIAFASVVGLPPIAWRKYVVAGRVPSRALHTDAHITVLGAATALLTVVGLLLSNVGLPAADPVAALLVAACGIAVAVRELRSGAVAGVWRRTRGTGDN